MPRRLPLATTSGRRTGEPWCAGLVRFCSMRRATEALWTHRPPSRWQTGICPQSPRLLYLCLVVWNSTFKFKWYDCKVSKSMVKCDRAFLRPLFNRDGSVQTLKKSKFTVLVRDYIKLLAYSGARRNEALGLRWPDVDFERGQLTIGTSGDTKNRTARVVDFNPKLNAHLLDMRKRCAPDSEWLFPSPQRGQKDLGARSFQESLRLVRERAGMPGFHFHDCRHHFISMAVMSGVDFMTIAAWVGHRDGGVLIGRVYGHLANEHRKAMGERMNFGPVAVAVA